MGKLRFSSVSETFVLTILCILFVSIYSVDSKNLCATPDEECGTFKPCCGRHLICKRLGSAEGQCVRCSRDHEHCNRSSECCLGVCMNHTCRHIMRDN
ncbi:hypothetical protein CSKR_112200 [Clonorchis sinensis]|uniref:Uncharacterized protein n=2 Tax=Clonorchis sinensis TaxID=79923 RepID=G7YD78_CLOSI|nr:hypothetical protein CSKR_112200 [Clonorchis sinensis]GAA50912.1 hypothetical protein CLF_105216 [Clonorchis sinensis]